MKVQQIMTTDVEVVRPDASVHEAAEKMRKLDVGVLPVCDGDRLVGMITDRDITIRATAEGWNADNTFVHQVMTPEIVYCFEDDNTQEAENLMQQKQIRRLPVLNREKRLVGILALGDLATKTGEVQEIGRTTREVSQPAH